MSNIFLSLKTLFAALVMLLVAFAPKAYAADPCDVITDAPTLYQIDRTPTEATLFFTPVNNDQVQSYTVTYGLKAEDESNSISFNQGASTGAISYTIGNLVPGVQYYYKVSGNTSCTSSPWSAWVGDKAVTEGKETIIPASALPVTGTETTVIFATASSLMILFGFGLYTYSRKRS